MADAVYHDAARVFPLPERLDKAVEEAADLGITNQLQTLIADSPKKTDK